MGQPTATEQEIEQGPPTEGPPRTTGVTTFRDLLAEATPRTIVTPVVLALNALLFVAMLASGISLLSPQVDQLLDWGASFGPYVFSGEWWRTLSSMFVHIGILHLALNMQCLWRLGPLTERLFGNWAFLALYVLSGLGGAIASLWWNPDVVSAGASGAIFGVAGGLAAFLYRARLPVPPRIIQSNLASVVSFIGYNLLYGFANSGIDNAAHLGGLVTGAAIGALLVRPLAPGEGRSRLGRFLVVAFVVLALAVGTILANAQDPDAAWLRAERLLAGGETDRAITEIQAALERDPASVTGHFLLGNAYFQQDEPWKAATAYTEAIALDTQAVWAYYNRGLTYTLLTRYDDALIDFDRVIELDPSDGNAYLMRGIVYYRKLQPERAIPDLEQALDLGLAPEAAADAESILAELGE